MFFKRLDYKYYFVIVMSYALLLFLAIGCIFTQSDRVYKQIEFYDDNEYQYTYRISSPVKENDYLYGESIYFYTDKNLSISLLGDCVMSLDDTKYTENTPLTLSKSLGKREIALSYNLAKQHNLSVGSKVYSKHNIRNVVEEYTVSEILPVCYGITFVDYEINRGVMLIGYDSDYVEYTDYTYIAFSKEDPTSLIQNSGAGLIALDAKASARDLLFESVAIWQAIITVLVFGLTLLYTMLHWKNQRNYYSRLYLSGASSSIIKRQILADLLLPGIISQLLATVFCILMASIANMYFSYKTTLISMIVGVVVLLCSTIIITMKGRKV